jgi:hypothetical protein
MSDDIVTRLRMLGGLDAALCNKAADEIERLRAERDEARRWICEQKASCSDRDAKWWAGLHTWDCFKEVEHD